jgi:LCP family protein required for cell wall assembly
VGGQRSDTIKIFHIDPASGTARVLSIPRDTYVTTSGLAPSTGLAGPEKINAAFNNGPEPLIETIENTFGIPISHWIVIDFDGVIDSVKALGGIRLDFRYPVRDDNDGVNESGLNITDTGCQELDGAQVLALSRSRYYEYYEDGVWQIDPGYDLSRILRQNTIIEAMIAKAKSTYNPLTLQSFINSVKSNISIDDNLSLGTIYDLVERYHAFSSSSLQTWTLPTLPQTGTPAGDVELVNTEPSGNYVNTITEFLGAPPGNVTTPPLDHYGYPIAVPVVTPGTLPTGPPLSAGTTPSTVSPSSLPSYDPTLC